MYGGILSKANIIIIQDQDLLIASFSHQIYEFSIQQATLKNIRTHHQHQILDLHYDEQNSIVRSVDETGTVFTYSVAKDRKADNIKKEKRVFGKNQVIKSARLKVNENDTEIYGLTQSGKLLRYSNKTIGTISDQCSKLLYLSDEYLITLQDTNIIQIINPANLEAKFIYEHNSEVTSIEVYQHNLIVGDEKGKINILVGFLENGEIKMRQKLQWHVHEVSALKINGAYLYSAGEEGVVVMWHLRENIKDFLPRIGSKIENLIVKQSKIYCLLSDNTIKSIDFNNDKAVSHFKVIINPQMNQISSHSSKHAVSNLIRVSRLQDKIYLRSLPGRVQQINLHSGINTEYNILNRNLISRLDNNLPTPHQITDFCFTKDGTHLVVAIEGVNCRCLKFYEYDKEDFKLVSKVDNCHIGQSRITLLNIGDNKFISYANDDSRIKVWKLSIRRKQSIMEIEQHFWCCDYEITFRQMLPRHVSFDSNRIIITLDRQFIIFNITKKIIENVYERQAKGEKIVAVQGLSDPHHSLLIFYENKIELVKSLKEITIILKISHPNNITSDSIVFSKNGDKFALLINENDVSHIYAYTLNDNISHYEIPKLKGRYLTDIFWLGQRLMGFDSSLFFYDLTHQKPLVTLSNKIPQDETEMDIQEQSQSIILDYQSLYKRYLQKQFRKDKSSVEKTNQVLGVTPSIAGCFSMLVHQIFI